MNNINEIDLSSNKNLKALFIWNNNLETEVECEALAVNETTIENQIFVYPNPIKSTLRISDFNNKISKIVIYDLLGNVILKINKNIIDFSKNKKSVYFLKILMKKGAIVNKKIIKI